MSLYGSSSRAGSAGPSGNSFISRLTSLGPPDSGVGDSVDLGSTADMDLDTVAEEGQEDDSIFHPALLMPSVEEDELDDVRRLGRVWVRERGTPAILQWEGDLLDELLDKLEQQQKMLITLREDDTTSEEEHFRLVLVQTEMERAKFLVRSYVRTRLFKIEKYAQHIVDTPNLHELLSGAELDHARKYADLVATHFRHSALDSLPEWLQKLDDTNMVPKPNLATPVLIYCRKDCGDLPLERGETAVLAEGTTHLLRYDLVDRWIQLGMAEVL